MAFAVGTLTSSGAFTDTQTITIGGKVYTTQTTLTNVDGNVLIGANAAATIDNLYAAINLGAGAGTTYAAAMTAHPHVVATSETDTTLVVKARVDGSIGNLIGTTETQTNASWGGTVLASGSGALPDTLRALISRHQLAAAVAQEIYDLTDPAGAL
jgi:hypothetical protein